MGENQMKRRKNHVPLIFFFAEKGRLFPAFPTQKAKPI
jgi:hypothetical protein